MTESSALESAKNTDCIVCWEPTQKKLELACGHDACRPCIENWIEQCEKDGQDNATCPHCRHTIHTEAILGRPYQKTDRNSTSSNNDSPTAVDDSFTQFWLQENNAHQCFNCGMWMIQEDDDDGGLDETLATACVCGYIYCWTCRGGAQDCDCDHSEFYDQLTDMTLDMDDASRFPVAGPEHFQDSLASFMEERREAIYDHADREDYEDEEEEERIIQEEPAEANFVALFGDLMKTETQSTGSC